MRITPNPGTTNQGITKKIKSALLHLNTYYHNDQVLIQFWVPIRTETGCFLLTSDQPFGLTYLDEGLLEYRKHCLNYKINVDGEEEQLGLPGRVFRKKLHEYIPDVQYYSIQEYPQRSFALTCGISSSSALPVFHSSSPECVGVLEFVTNAADFDVYDIMFDPFLMHAVENADLRRSACDCLISSVADENDSDDVFPHILVEIYFGLKVVCRTYKLPLALVWVPCKRFNTMDNSSDAFDVSCMGQVLHADNRASYLLVDNLEEFLGFSGWNNLQKGQGVVGSAHRSHKLCFCRDISQFSLTEYPLLPIAGLFGLTSCFAIYLQSTCAENSDYILEFFLPLETTYVEDPTTFLSSLLETMRQHFPSFKLPSGEELGVEFIKPRMNQEPASFQCQSTPSPSGFGVLHNRQEANSITLEELKKHFEKKLGEVARKVSGPKCKRKCREKGTPCWPPGKRNKANDSLSRWDPLCSDLPAETLAAIVSHMTPLVTPPPPEARMVIIIATYGNDMIKFRLSLSSRIVELEEAVSKRLKLNAGTYEIKYMDDAGDWILIARDKDLEDCKIDCGLMIGWSETTGEVRMHSWFWCGKLTKGSANWT
ncbi:protein NLP6-like [Cornus florida]|uniref:protein NLP6-like n=1 Tax=Cornus florida TaxID=4283 RepID=UPI00289DAE46|nr:protein NLP6-like [Cornus florida]